MVLLVKMARASDDWRYDEIELESSSTVHLQKLVELKSGLEQIYICQQVLSDHDTWIFSFRKWMTEVEAKHVCGVLCKCTIFVNKIRL